MTAPHRRIRPARLLPPLPMPLPLVRATVHPVYRIAFNHRLPWTTQRRLLDLTALLQPLPKGTAVQPMTLAGRRAERVTAGPVEGREAILYLHGGGFTVGSMRTHRSLAAYLARDTRRPVYLLDYRLAPEHPYPAGMDDTLAALRALADEHGHPADSIVLGGDSAGGGIALAAAQQLLTRDDAKPAALVLISPWTDPNVIPERHRDLVINRTWGSACVAAYLGQGDPADPRFAPRWGTLAGLPPTYIHINTTELLYDPCTELATAMREAGVALRFVESTTLWHCAQAQAGLLREAADSLRDIADFLTREIWAAREDSGSARPGALG
ncbi:alpha/beta fold hydrolase [Nocardia sp. NPDC051570]|uniref:alpha/beta fold hydrolase n=1 Tax=Nocardia sp. NPDC051570 TaxID=3364324 RepID=UPI0037B8258C